MSNTVISHNSGDPSSLYPLFGVFGITHSAASAFEIPSYSPICHLNSAILHIKSWAKDNVHLSLASPSCQSGCPSARVCRTPQSPLADFHLDGFPSDSADTACASCNTSRTQLPHPLTPQLHELIQINTFPGIARWVTVLKGQASCSLSLPVLCTLVCLVSIPAPSLTGLPVLSFLPALLLGVAAHLWTLLRALFMPPCNAYMS